MKTAVSKFPLLLAIVLAPLLCLGWVTQLMAQVAPARPDFIITEPVTVDTDGADSYQIRFVGLLPDGGDGYLSVEGLTAVPITNSALIHVVSTDVVSLENTPFYISLVIDTSGSMAITNTQAPNGNLVLVQEQLETAVNLAPTNTHFAIVGFNGNIRPENFTAFTNTKTVIINQIWQLQSQNGSTCLDDVAYTAVQSLAQLPQNSRRAIILFTDGVDEVTRGQSERCSQSHTYQDALDLAAAPTQTVAIPLHTVNYPYGDGEILTPTKPLTSQNHILTGLSLDANSFPLQFNEIITSFIRQWAATIELYTPPGSYDLELTPLLQDGSQAASQTFTYAAGVEHFPAALANSLALDNIAYNEGKTHFEINLRLCPPELLAQETAVPYCNPARIQTLELLVEDLFNHQTVRTILPVGAFEQHTEPQTVAVPQLLEPEHYYLIRITAKNDVTSANYHPRAEAIFAYRPTLAVNLRESARLEGFSLYPDLTLSLELTRSSGTAQAAAALLANGRSFFNQVTPNVPEMVTVGGYLVYPDRENPQELYPLTPQTVTYSNRLTLTFPQAAAGGYADYDLFLTVQDSQKAVGATLTETTVIDPDLWYGRSFRQVRRVLAEPLLFVVAILASLLLLGLIWLVIWLARRSFKEEMPPPVVVRKTDPVPALIYVDASPDKQIHHKTFHLPDAERPFRIGRDQEIELPVRADENMANLHAQIQKMGHDYYIISRDADRATYINNQEIITNAPFRIQTGDKIRLGPHTRFTFTAPQEAQEIKENVHQ